MDQKSLKFVSMLEQGEVCLHPAGTLYGLTCDPFNKEATDRIFAIKNRPQNKSFLYLSSSIDKAFKFWKPLPVKWEKALKSIWPNHLTVVWSIKDSVSGKIVHTDLSVGIRVPKYSESFWFSEVLETLEAPIPTTSLNYSGEDSLTAKEDILSFCDENEIFYVSDDEGLTESDSKTLPSTIIKIIDQDNYQLLREGAFDVSMLEKYGLYTK